MKNNTKGSALVWAIVVTLMLAILIAAGLTMSYSYYNRSINNNSKNQAYLSAKSIITNMVENIAVTSGEDIPNQSYLNLIPDETGKSTAVSVESYPVTLGTVNYMKIERKLVGEGNEEKKDIITITVSLTYLDYTEVVNADLINTSKGEATWQLLKYYRSEPDKNQNNVKGLKLNDEMMIDAVTNREGAIEKLKNMSQELKDKIKKEQGTTINNQFGNDQMRNYYFYAVYDEEWPVFDNEATSIPNILGSKQYYIQPYFIPGSDYKNYIVFASTYKNKTNGIWGEDIKLLYYQGHWYYIDKSINIHGQSKKGIGNMVSAFNGESESSNTADNKHYTADEKFKYIVDNYLIAENQIT